MRMLLIVDLRTDASVARISQDAPKILEIVQAVSNGDYELVFRSPDRGLFGIFLASDVPMDAIRARIESSTGVRNGEGVMLVEVGNRPSTVGFTRAGAWLQHH